MASCEPEHLDQLFNYCTLMAYMKVVIHFILFVHICDDEKEFRPKTSEKCSQTQAKAVLSPRFSLGLNICIIFFSGLIYSRWLSWLR